MRCLSAKMKLRLLVGGDLPDGQRAPLMEHLEGCPGCAALLEQLRSYQGAVGQIARADRPKPLSEDFAWQVQRQITTGQYRPKPTAQFGRGIGWKSAWAALFGALVVLYMVFSPEPEQGRETVLQQKTPTGPRAEIEWGGQWVAAIEGPYRLDEWQGMRRPGVYAVMHRPAPKAKPNTYLIDYCGESQTGLAVGNPWLQYLRRQITERVGAEDEIYVALYPISSRRERQRLHRFLVKRWAPFFNRPKGA